MSEAFLKNPLALFEVKGKTAIVTGAPKAPDAPVTMAVLPLTSNRESGFFKKSSDIVSSVVSFLPLPASEEREVTSAASPPRRR